MDIVQSVALAGGLAWASGMRLYAVLFTAGMLSRFGYLHLPATLHVLENPLVLGVAGVMLTIEFLADKIPAVDSFWDSAQTFVRIPAGALLAALAMGDHDPALMLAAGLLGGTLTAGTHAAKAGSRALINTSPEPFSNIAASFGEEAAVATGLFAAIHYPVVFLVLLGVFVLLLIWILPKLLRGAKLVFSRLFTRTSEGTW
jgi:type II secretory pathway component PulF